MVRRAVLVLRRHTIMYHDATTTEFRRLIIIENPIADSAAVGYGRSIQQRTADSLRREVIHLVSNGTDK